MLKNNKYSIRKYKIGALSLLIGTSLVLGINSEVQAVEYSHKDIKELSVEQKQQIQKGTPSSIVENDQIVYVYQHNGQGNCELEPNKLQNKNTTSILPNTGLNSNNLLTIGLGLTTLGAAVYLLSNNKKGRKTFLVLTLVGGSVLGSHTILASNLTGLQEQIRALVIKDAKQIASAQTDLNCFEYVGYLKITPPTLVTPDKPVEPVTPPTPTPDKPVEPVTPPTPVLPDVKKGSVVVNYQDAEGNKIQESKVILKDVEVGTDYITSTKELKPEKITTEDGKIYTLIPTATKGNESGKVSEGTTEVTYIYTLEIQKAKIKYINITDNKNTELQADSVEGSSGKEIEYSTSERIRDFQKRGYTLVSDGFTNSENKNYDFDTSVDQEFIVKLEERIVPVTPDDNPKPETPVYPNDPDTPNWPKEVKNMQELRRRVQQTINYRRGENGKEVYDIIKRTATYERIAYINLVTGGIEYTAWRVASVTDERQ